MLQFGCTNLGGVVGRLNDGFLVEIPQHLPVGAVERDQLAIECRGEEDVVRCDEAACVEIRI